MGNINLATDNTLLVRLFELRRAYLDGNNAVDPWDNLACDLFKELDTLRTAYAKSLENKPEDQQKQEPFGYVSQRCLEHIRDDENVGDTWPISAIPRDVHANLKLNIPLYAAPVPPVSLAIRDVISERQRQISAEGWTTEHDDQYSRCEMAAAAACYIMADADPRADTPTLWPWSPDWWKPTNPRRDLVKAGALILAEIERIDRAASRKGGDA